MGPSTAVTSFILQVHAPMSPGLTERLQRALAELGVGTTLVAVEPCAGEEPAEVANDQDPQAAPSSGYGEPVAKPASLPRDPQGAAETPHQASARGEERLVKWTQDGTLVDGKRLSEAWGITRQALDKARERGEIFSIRVGVHHYYPAESVHFRRADLAEINRALGDIDSGSKLIFLMRKHGTLGGHTAAEAVDDRQLTDVLRLAQTWARN